MNRLSKTFLVISSVSVLAVASALIVRHFNGGKETLKVPLGLEEKAIRKISRGGKGFIVWERSHNDAWEIWTKGLDGGSERLMVPREPDRDHFCPKLSPDGGMLAYMSYQRGSNAYSSKRGLTGTLRVMNLRTGKSNVIADAARSYCEDRAVTWLDNRRMCFIDGDGQTSEAELSKGGKRRVIREASKDFGYLPSPDLRHATSGVPEFAKLDESGGLQRQPELSGCQPYFTSDSRWGFWMGGAGGPLSAMRLATREVKTLLTKDDPRLHEKRNYIYFPMISSDMRLLTFAASRDRHDHFEADYDIYVAPINPRTLDVIGWPVRYTKDPACDRYPDVYQQELPLGSHFLEGENTLTFTVPGDAKSGRWKFGDGTDATGKTVTHTFRESRDYWIECLARVKGKDIRYRGYVFVNRALPPVVKRVRRTGDRVIEIIFDEEIDPSKANVKICNDMEVIDVELIRENMALAVTTAKELPSDAFVEIEGIRDSAHAASKMGRLVLGLPRNEWPPTRTNLVFSWLDGKNKSSSVDAVGTHLAHHGTAFFNEQGALKLQGGWFDMTGPITDIGETCRKSDAFTFEFIATPQALDGGSNHGIVLSLFGPDGPLCEVSQRDEELFIRLTTSTGVSREGDLGRLLPGVPNHVLVWLDDGELRATVNGVESRSRKKLIGHLREWQPTTLRFGASYEGAAPWKGLIDRVLFYSEPLSQLQIRRHCDAATSSIARRTPVNQWNVKLRLVEATPVPSLKEILPYREALVRHLYEEVVPFDKPSTAARRIIVTQWAWMDGQAMPAQKLKVGDVVNLLLEGLESHGELDSLLVKDSLDAGFDIDRAYDASDWDQPLRVSP